MVTDIRKAQGAAVREWRLKRDLSQVELGRLAGVTQASISNYETGKRDMPLSTAVAFAEALDVSLLAIAQPGTYEATAA